MVIDSFCTKTACYRGSWSSLIMMLLFPQNLDSCRKRVANRDHSTGGQPLAHWKKQQGNRFLESKAHLMEAFRRDWFENIYHFFRTFLGAVRTLILVKSKKMFCAALYKGSTKLRVSRLHLVWKKGIFFQIIITSTIFGNFARDFF